LKLRKSEILESKLKMLYAKSDAEETESQDERAEQF
jgi:hypothetical protein